MSGGSLDYFYFKVEWGIENVIQQINPGNPGLFANQELLLEFVKHLRLVSEALHDIEWETSGDYGEGDSLPAIRKVLGYEELE